MIKEIIVAIEFNDDQIKAISCEYYNTRYNVLCFDSVVCKDIERYWIKDREKVKTSLKNLITKIEKKLDTKVLSVLLVLPPINFQRKSLFYEINTANGTLLEEDVSKCVESALHSEVDNDLYVVNVYPLRFNVNNITYKVPPYNEKAANFSINIELLCASKKLVYDYVELLDEIGLDVIDISLSNYGVIKESLIFEKSTENNVLLLDISKNNSTISFVSDSKINSVEIFDFCFNDFIIELKRKYDIEDEIASNLIKYYLVDNPDEEIVYSFRKNNINYTINKQELFEICSEKINKYTEYVSTIIKPIVENKDTVIFITGIGSEIDYLTKQLVISTSCNCCSYFPEIIGIRNYRYTNLYGSLYAHKELFDLRKRQESSVNLLDINNKVVQLNKNNQDDEMSITQKLKNLIFEKSK